MLKILPSLFVVLVNLNFFQYFLIDLCVFINDYFIKNLLHQIETSNQGFLLTFHILNKIIISFNNNFYILLFINSLLLYDVVSLSLPYTPLTHQQNQTMHHKNPFNKLAIMQNQISILF